MDGNLSDGDRRMSSGAIAGLVIGIFILIGLIVFLIIWLLRFRHYWASRKHTKMSNHSTEICMPGGAHNNPYMLDGSSDGPVNSDMWGLGSNKAAGEFFGQQWPTNFATTSSGFVVPNSTYPTSDATARWPEITEARVEPTLIKPVQNAMALRAANPTAYLGVRGDSNFEQAGDLSRSVTGPTGALYPQLGSYLNSGEEPTTTTTTSSGGKQMLTRETSQRLRSKVRMAARVSQLSMFNLRPRRRTSTRMHDSTKGRPKRRRGTRTSSVTIGATTVMGGPKFSMTPGEGYHNMNVISDNFEFDELGSLDNDGFLCSLERAVYPGLECSQPSSSSISQTHRSQCTQPNDPYFRGLGFVSNVVYPMSDFQSLATADLSLGGESGQSGTWRPLPPDVDSASISHSTQPYGFRFPAPGPPVSGWAHQLAEIRMQTETQSTLTTTPTMATSALGQSSSATATPTPCEPTAPTAPVIQPPPTVSSPTIRTTPSVMKNQTGEPSSSAAIPRRRAQKRAKSRQQSEPRTSVSRMTGDQSDPFGQIDSSTDEPASN
ncbi:hypothetical protein D915_003641 [Fasciola hepatica]|uniref:Uncharacterized protein n=1 Tax=Fasciola hepatica TaxID=6192 RepID=A0A4E0S0K3_FASHE|nr:hypothetical protein D915_003641 [Fasciola hepatica]